MVYFNKVKIFFSKKEEKKSGKQEGFVAKKKKKKKKACNITRYTQLNKENAFISFFDLFFSFFYFLK
jgi:hypothetical protein